MDGFRAFVIFFAERGAEDRSILKLDLQRHAFFSRRRFHRLANLQAQRVAILEMTNKFLPHLQDAAHELTMLM